MLPTANLPPATSAVMVSGTDDVPTGSVLTYDEGKWLLWGDPVTPGTSQGVIFSFRAAAAAAAA